MNKPIAILVILLLLGLGSAAHAVDLEAGWYVKLFGVSLGGLVGEGGWQVVNWHFTGGLGTSGPFEVTSPDPLWAERVVSVPQTVKGVTAGTSVYLWGEPVSSVDFIVRQLGVGYDTLYDASRMRLDVLMYKESEGFTLLWSQGLSGFQQGWPNVLEESQAIPVGYQPVFRVAVVPEPCSTSAMLVGITLAVVVRRRRKQ